MTGGDCRYAGDCLLCLPCSGVEYLTFQREDCSETGCPLCPLASTLSRAVALGDEVAARVVHEAIGRLLGLPVAPEG
ncbi:hypothetical protein [Sorangium sp. So ce1078]|uniref:hypothetical protein n=1 Tax=Sorangium sp. So ce1078 TaxID=3133329 RepID=UPI003F5FCC76